MKMSKCMSVVLFGLMLALMLSGCKAGVSAPAGEEITVAELCKEDAAVFEDTPVSLTYTKSEGEPDTYSAEITDPDAAMEILEIILDTKVLSEGQQVDMYWQNSEDYFFVFRDEAYNFCILPDSFVSYGGLYYEITESRLETARDILAEYAPKDETAPVSEWYGPDAELETNFVDNGDEARSYTEIFLSCSEGMLEGYIEGCYDILSIEPKADCYILNYTYGDFYSHEEERRCRITVADGELVMEDLTE